MTNNKEDNICSGPIARATNYAREKGAKYLIALMLLGANTVPSIQFNFDWQTQKETENSANHSFYSDSLMAQNRPIIDALNKSPLKPKKINVWLTAYSSLPEQTDDTPFITATGNYVRDGIVAANFLPFGTKIRMPELFGEKIFVVEDRMHSRFQNSVDIWFADNEEAKKFGKQLSKIEIL
ncbi:MAG: hypothetical protein AAB405_00820 [Patescibacteria group bacterium]